MSTVRCELICRSCLYRQGTEDCVCPSLAGPAEVIDSNLLIIFKAVRSDLGLLLFSTNVLVGNAEDIRRKLEKLRCGLYDYVLSPRGIGMVARDTISAYHLYDWKDYVGVTSDDLVIVIPRREHSLRGFLFGRNAHESPKQSG